MEFHIPVPPSGQYTYYPGTTEVPERSAANVHNVSYKALAEVEFTRDAEGVIFAQGSRFGGHALFIKDGTLTYVYNFLGIPPENRDLGAAPRRARHIVGVEFTKERMGEYREGIGPLKLYIDDQVVQRRRSGRCMGHFSLCGEGLCIGYDSGDAVRAEYTARGSRSPAARSRRSCSTSPTTPTSTSRRTSPRRWRATERSSPSCHHARLRSRTTSTPSTRPSAGCSSSWRGSFSTNYPTPRS